MDNPNDIGYVKSVVRDLYVIGKNRVSQELFPKFHSVNEGILGTTPGTMFYVANQTTGTNDLARVTPTTITNVVDICSDGVNIYTFNAVSGMIYAIRIADLDGVNPVPILWSNLSPDFQPTCICCDGNRVFVGVDSEAGDVKIMSWSTAGDDYVGYSDASGDPIIGLASNGSKLAFIQSGVFSIINSVSMDGLVSDGFDVDSLSAVCISDQYVYITVANAPDREIFSFDMTGTFLSSAGIVGEAEERDWLSTDGRLLFYTGSIGVGESVVYAYDAELVDRVWYKLGLTFPSKSAVDDKHVYVDDLNNQMIMVFDKYTGKLKWQFDSSGYLVSDGMEVHYFFGDSFVTQPISYVSKLFVRTSGTDPWRSPFFNLAVPV